MPNQLNGKVGFNSPPAAGMVAWNDLIYEFLNYRWDDIINNYELFGIPRFKESKG